MSFQLVQQASATLHIELSFARSLQIETGWSSVVVNPVNSRGPTSITVQFYDSVGVDF